MEQAQHLITESIQEITLYAWPKVYGKHNDYDLDSRDVLEQFRNWGEEFEAWWIGHSEDWIESHDYLQELQEFADGKIKEYLKRDYVIDLTLTLTKRLTVSASSEGDAVSCARQQAREAPLSEWQRPLDVLVDNVKRY